MNNKEGFLKKRIKKVIEKAIAWYVNDKIDDLQNNILLIKEKQEILDLNSKENRENLSSYEGAFSEQLEESKYILKNLNFDINTKIKSIEEILEEQNFKIQNLEVFKEEGTNKFISIEEVLSNQSYSLNNLEEFRKEAVCKLDSIDNILKSLNYKVCICDEQIQDIVKRAGLSKEKSFDLFNKTTTSQAGEDSILAYIFSVLNIKLSDCTYLDLGANHAKQLSNTYFFYSMGAHGVLVEANPQLVNELKFYRSNDIILNKCISTKSGDIVPFYILNGDGLSSPDLESVEDAIQKNSALKIVDTINVETITVNDILDKYFVKAPFILNIDIEGLEEQIIESIDFNRYQPFAIIIERIEYSVMLQRTKRDDRIEELLSNKGYFEYAFTGINSIYLNHQLLDKIEAGGKYDTGNQ